MVENIINNTNEQLETIDNELKMQMGLIQSKTEKTIKDQLTPLTFSFFEQFKNFSENVTEQIEQRNTTLVKNFTDHFQMIENDHQEYLKRMIEEIKKGTDRQEEQIKFLQDQLKKVLELTDLDPEDTVESGKDDLVSIANKVAKQPTTRIARIATSQFTIGNKYYDNVNEQSKRSFEVSRRLSFIGGIIFIITISVVILTEAFHITHDPLLFPIGATVSGITELIAGINVLHDRSTKQFVRFHLFLDRMLRSSIAHAMSEDINDNGKKQEAIEKIIDDLLKFDDRIKG